MEAKLREFLILDANCLFECSGVCWVTEVGRSEYIEKDWDSVRDVLDNAPRFHQNKDVRANKSESHSRLMNITCSHDVVKTA